MTKTVSADKRIRLNFYMRPDLVEAIDEYADSLGVTRGAAINIICSLWCDSRNTLNGLTDIAKFGNASMNINK